MKGLVRKYSDRIIYAEFQESVWNAICVLRTKLDYGRDGVGEVQPTSRESGKGGAHRVERLCSKLSI